MSTAQRNFLSRKFYESATRLTRRGADGEEFSLLEYGSDASFVDWDADPARICELNETTQDENDMDMTIGNTKYSQGAEDLLRKAVADGIVPSVHHVHAHFLNCERVDKDTLVNFLGSVTTGLTKLSKRPVPGQDNTWTEASIEMYQDVLDDATEAALKAGCQIWKWSIKTMDEDRLPDLSCMNAGLERAADYELHIADNEAADFDMRDLQYGQRPVPHWLYSAVEDNARIALRAAAKVEHCIELGFERTEPLRDIVARIVDNYKFGIDSAKSRRELATYKAREAVAQAATNPVVSKAFHDDDLDSIAALN